MDPFAVIVPATALVVVGAAGAGLVLRARRARQPTPCRSTAPPAVEPSPADRLRHGLSSTRRRLRAQLDAVLGRGAQGVEAVAADLEEVLVAADVGTRTAATLVDRVRTRLAATGGDGTRIHEALRAEVEALLAAPAERPPDAHPWVVLVTGVNGVGKTTTIGKLAALHANAGRRVMLVAADTFRAAAIEQLAVWAERTGATIVRHGPGADPSAVVFDGLAAALARHVDVVLIDTAGRLHTRTPLMEELKKLRRVIDREVPGAPHETLLVLDATTGQNAVSQARTFTEAAPVTGVVLTKLDGTARGGIALAVRDVLGLPIRYVGVGEAVDDLRVFVAHDFAEALLGTTAAPAEDPSGRHALTGVEAPQ